MPMVFPASTSLDTSFPLELSNGPWMRSSIPELRFFFAASVSEKKNTVKMRSGNNFVSVIILRVNIQLR